MDRFPILDNAGIFPQFEALYRDFLRTLIGESTPTDDDVARFMQAMVDAEAVFTQNFSTNDPRDLDEDDNDNADEDDSDALESDSEDEDDNEELTEDEDDVDEGTQTVRFYTSAGAPKARPHGYGIELTFASGYVPSSKCVCEKWKNHNATPTENSLMSPKKRKHNNSANDSNAMDAHARNYIPLLHVYQWLHAQTEAKCQKGKIPLDNLRRAIPNLKISDKSAVDTKDVSQTQTPTTHTQPNVATRHRAKAMFRHIFLSSQPLLNGHQPAALTSLLTSANTTAVCPHLALAAAPLPKPCRCVKQAYIGWFHHGERVRGISVFADGGALEKSEVSASFVYHHEDGRTSIYVAAGGETAVGVSSDVKESSGADNEDTANDDGEDGEDVDDEDEDGNEDEGAEVDDEDNAGEGDEDEDGDEDEEEDVASVVIERDSTGAITFAGRAVGGVKHGAGAFAAGDGALFLGNWHRGEFSCDEGSWLIPSGNCHLGVQLQQLQGSKHPAEDKVATVKDDAAEKAPVVLAYYHGAWRKGRAVDTRTLIYEHAAPLTSPSLAAKLLAADKDTVKYDISSPTRISRTPMQPDAWESVWVRVCNSKINLSPAGTAAAGAAEKVEEEADKATAKNKGAKRGAAAAASKDAKKPRIVAGDAVAEAAEEVLQNLDAGEGLVAARLIPKGTIVAWYNGTRPSTKEVDSRSWELNGNTMTLVEGKSVCIDIPAPYDSTASYVASRGHKANHDFHRERINSAFDSVTHPRFADIKCVVATKDIPPGTEISIDYGYNRSRGGPDWFRAGIAARRKVVLEQLNAKLPPGAPRRTHLTPKEVEELLGEPPATHHGHMIKDLRDCDVRLLPVHAAIAVMAARLAEML